MGPCFYHQSHPQLGIVFALAPSLHSFWSCFSTDLQYHIGNLPTWGVHLSMSYFLPFHTLHGVLKERILKWFAIPFSSAPHFVRTLHHDLSVLGELHSRSYFIYGSVHLYIQNSLFISPLLCPLITLSFFLCF